MEKRGRFDGKLTIHSGLLLENTASGELLFGLFTIANLICSSAVDIKCLE